MNICPQGPTVSHNHHSHAKGSKNGVPINMGKHQTSMHKNETESINWHIASYN